VQTVVSGRKTFREKVITLRCMQVPFPLNLHVTFAAERRGNFLVTRGPVRSPVQAIPEPMAFLGIPPTSGGMAIDAVIPFKPKNPKTRLSCVMEQEEREAFAQAMLSDVIAAAQAGGCSPLLLCTSPYERPGARTLLDPDGLNESLNRLLATSKSPILIIMADLPLADGAAVSRLVSTAADMAVVPGRGGGTNAIFLREPSRFRVNYYGASFLKHMQIAMDAGLSVDVVDSFRLHTDVDEKEDLVEVLIHGKGEARRCLESLGFTLSIEGGRVGVKRGAHKETR